MSKKIILTIALVILVAFPSLAAEKVKFSINLGGFLTSVSQGYDFSHSYETRDETASWTESVPNVGSTFGFDVGVGVYPVSELEVYASYSGYSGTSVGSYSLTVPHFYYYDQPVSSSIGDIENGFRSSAINFGLAFHPSLSGRVKPYFGAGVSSVNVKVDLVNGASLDDLIYVEEYEDLWDYWYIVDESIDIKSVGFKEESKTVLGFHAKAGVNIEIAKNVYIFSEARYLSATAKFDHPKVTARGNTTLEYYLYYYGSEYYDSASKASEEELIVDKEIEIKAGGVQGILGLKIFF